jgi:hypothetical protein
VTIVDAFFSVIHSEVPESGEEETCKQKYKKYNSSIIYNPTVVISV